MEDAINEEVGNRTPVSTEASPPRRRVKVILTVALSGTLGGFLISCLFPPQYVAQSTVLVEGQKVPPNYVQPIITADFTQRVQTLSQQVLSANSLRVVIDNRDLAKPGEEGKLLEDIRAHLRVTPLITSMSQTATTTYIGAQERPSSTVEPAPGFNVSYTDSKPERAQKICNAMTSLILNEELRSRAEAAMGTTDFFRREVENAKNELGAKEEQLALSKNRSPRSPEAEAEYRVLALEYDVAQKAYVDLLTKLTQAELAKDMESQAMGEQMAILAPASLHDSPIFPNRPLFALWGLGAGVLLGIGHALWPARKAKTPTQSAILQRNSAVDAKPRAGQWP